MNIQEMHYDFRLKLDNVDSLTETDFKDWEIDWILNRAIDLFVDNKYSPTFEYRQRDIDDLKTITVKSPQVQPGIVPVLTPQTGVYEVPIDSSFVENYRFLIRLNADIDKTNCSPRYVICKPVQHDDLSEALEDPFNQPSFHWKKVLYVMGQSSSSTNTNGSIYLYTNNDFTISKVYPEYIRDPKQVHRGTYTDINGNSTLVNCDLPTYTHSKIVDIAVYITANIVENPDFIQLKQNLLTLNK